MSFGLAFVNNSDVVTLDSEFSRLVVLQSGRYTGGSSFSPVITTEEPPMVFVRPDSNITLQYVTILGTPGNWTGWNYIGGGSGNYFAAAFKSRAVAKFGLRLWDANSNLLFDNGTACAQFTNVVTSYTYAGSVPTGQPGQSRASFTAPATFPNGDYMMINNIGMDVAGTSTRYAKLACTLNLAGNITMAITGVNNGTGGFFIPAVFAKPI